MFFFILIYMSKRNYIIIILLFLIFCSGYFSCKKLIKKPVNPYITLYLNESDQTIELDLEEYIVGVVAAEMPAGFKLEALKAQAVCARTYTIKKIGEKHNYPQKADLSDDINTCQAYIDPQLFQEAKGRASINRIRKAVSSTRGEVLIYKGKVIDAVYHSTCGGQTENAGEVWSRELPYLKSVKCNYCHQSPHYRESFVWSETELKRILRVDKISSLKIIKSSSHGRVKQVKVNEQKIDINTFRSKLNLPSNYFLIKRSSNKVIIQSKGYGHGVGLCQYGANGMAASGKNYRQILQHYYHNGDIYTMPY